MIQARTKPVNAGAAFAGGSGQTMSLWGVDVTLGAYPHAHIPSPIGGGSVLPGATINGGLLASGPIVGGYGPGYALLNNIFVP